MTKEELKRELYSYRDIVRELKQVDEKLAQVQSRMASPKAGISSGTGSGSGSGDPMLDMVATKIRLEGSYKQLRAELLARQERIEGMIRRLGPKERALMRCYYTDCKTWEQVGMALHYSWSQVHRIHNSALLHLLELEKME